MRAELQRLREANPISPDQARAWLETDDAARARSNALESDAPVGTGRTVHGRRRWLVALAAGLGVLAVALPALFGSPSIGVSTTVTPAEGDPFYTEVITCVALATGIEHPATPIQFDDIVTESGQSVLAQAATDHPVEYQDCFDEVIGRRDFAVVEVDVPPESTAAIALVDPDWLLTEDDVTPTVTDPQERITISNYPLEVGGDRCAQVPVNALEALGPDDFLLQVLQRAGSSAGFPPRPATFAGRIQGIDEGDHLECVSEAERSDIGTLRWIDFELEEQGFYALIVLGTDLPVDERHEVERALDSFQVSTP